MKTSFYSSSSSGASTWLFKSFDGLRMKQHAMTVTPAITAAAIQTFLKLDKYDVCNACTPAPMICGVTFGIMPRAVWLLPARAPMKPSSSCGGKPNGRTAAAIFDPRWLILELKIAVKMARPTEPPNDRIASRMPEVVAIR